MLVIAWDNEMATERAGSSAVLAAANQQLALYIKVASCLIAVADDGGH